jgi:hypothetical protein
VASRAGPRADLVDPDCLIWNIFTALVPRPTSDEEHRDAWCSYWIEETPPPSSNLASVIASVAFNRAGARAGRQGRRPDRPRLPSLPSDAEPRRRRRERQRLDEPG